MRKYLAALGFTGLIAVAAPSSALAGGALATQLLPTPDAIDCAAASPCESDGMGAVATLKVMGTNNMAIGMQGVLPNTMYHATINGGGLCLLENVIATLPSQADGTFDDTVALTVAPDLGDVIEICRAGEFGPVAIAGGTLGRLNGR